MRFRDDRRGASLQVGVVVLLGFVVVSMALWQAQVVPAKNGAVEFQHNQRVRDDMTELRGAVLAAPGRSGSASVRLSLGPRYPRRGLFANPRPPQGTIRTAGTADPGVNVTVGNATALDAETADYWNGSDRTFNTGALLYEPGYNEYDGAPVTIYENSVLFDRHASANVTRAGQALIDGTRVTLVVLNGSLAETRGGSYSVDLQGVSTSGRTVEVTDASGNVTVSFASRLNGSRWTALLAGETTTDGGHVVDVRSEPIDGPYHDVTVELEGGVTYELRLAKVGVGTGVAREDAHYVTDVAGNDSTVVLSGSKQLVVEVRDRFDNPKSGVRVNASAASGGSVSPRTRTTDGEGRAVFSFSPTSTGAATATFNISGNPTDRETVTFELEVTRGVPTGTADGAYDVSWAVPSGQPAVSCSGDTCTLDAGVNDTVELEATTAPAAVNASIRYAQNNTSVGGFSTTTGTTDRSGTHTVTYTASRNGTTTLYTSGRADGDDLVLVVENVTGGGGDNPPSGSIDAITDNSQDCTRNPAGNCVGGSQPRVEFDVDWSASDPDGDITNVTVQLIDPDGVLVDEDVNTFGGTGSASGTSTLVDDPGQWNAEYTVRLIVEDANGNTDTTTRTEVADGS